VESSDGVRVASWEGASKGERPERKRISGRNLATGVQEQGWRHAQVGGRCGRSQGGRRVLETPSGRAFLEDAST